MFIVNFENSGFELFQIGMKIEVFRSDYKIKSRINPPQYAIHLQKSTLINNWLCILDLQKQLEMYKNRTMQLTHQLSCVEQELVVSRTSICEERQEKDRLTEKVSLVEFECNERVIQTEQQLCLAMETARIKTNMVAEQLEREKKQDDIILNEKLMEQALQIKALQAQVKLSEGKALFILSHLSIV